MKKSVMSVKEMVALYVNYCASEETWDMLRNMALHGLISSENWDKFFKTTKDWFADDEGIVDLAGNLIYKYDEEGFLVKVA